MDSTQNISLIDNIRAVLAQAFNISLEEITSQLTFGDIPQWDSLGHMEVMMRLEEHFGIEINADTIANLTSINAIRDYLDHSKPRE